MQAVKQETNEMQDAAEEHDQEMAQLEEEVYEDEEVYNEEQIMPDEENDLSELMRTSLQSYLLTFIFTSRRRRGRRR